MSGSAFTFLANGCEVRAGFYVYRGPPVDDAELALLGVFGGG